MSRKRATVTDIKFGEKLMSKASQEEAGKAQPEMSVGLFVGVKATSGEVCTAIKEDDIILVEGLWKERNEDFVKHMPVEQKWRRP